MFPLGGVLFPSVVLPLHVFEPRYRAMTAHLLGGDVEPEFGVVLIERGSEVGGADQRSGVGTARPHRPGGRAPRRSVGLGHLRRAAASGCVEWLPDDPWPCAVVEDFPDRPAAPTASAEQRWAAAQVLVRRVLGLAAELGERLGRRHHRAGGRPRPRHVPGGGDRADRSGRRVARAGCRRGRRAARPPRSDARRAGRAARGPAPPGLSRSPGVVETRPRQQERPWPSSTTRASPRW